MIATGPCETDRFFTISVPFSIVVVSTMSPIGVLAVSDATQAPFSSLTTLVMSSGMVWPLTSMVAL